MIKKVFQFIITQEYIYFEFEIGICFDIYLVGLFENIVFFCSFMFILFGLFTFSMPLDYLKLLSLLLLSGYLFIYIYLKLCPSLVVLNLIFILKLLTRGSIFTKKYMSYQYYLIFLRYLYEFVCLSNKVALFMFIRFSYLDYFNFSHYNLCNLKALYF